MIVKDKQGGFSPELSTTAFVRKVEQDYREMVNAKLLYSLVRMQQPDYKAIPMPDNFHQEVLQRVLIRRRKMEK